jgi:hypothetical protein
MIETATSESKDRSSSRKLTLSFTNLLCRCHDFENNHCDFNLNFLKHSERSQIKFCTQYVIIALV